MSPIVDAVDLVPDDLERVVGHVLGRQPGVRPLPVVERGRSRGAFADEVLRALRRPPCVVSFSGGRDSSVLLALAVSLARQEGLPPPVAVTLVFPGVVEADERTWQETLISELGVADWIRIPVHAELDFVGPLALGVLRRHGVGFPSNAHAHVPIVEHAAGGSLLSGIGGDEVLGSPALHLTRALAGRVRPRREDIFDVRARLSRHYATGLGRVALEGRHWVTPEARDAAVAIEGDAQAWFGLRWGTALRRWATSRYRLASLATLETLAQDRGAISVAPFLASPFLAALAADGGASGFADRAAALRLLAGDLVPDRVLERRSKATFDRVFFGAPSRALAERWDGGGVDPRLVDVDALRDEWRSPSPDGRTSLLLQQVALAGAMAGMAT